MITIVGGCTRSGLTMTMQMLHAGGYPCAGEFPGFEPFPIGRAPWGRLDGYAVKLVDSHRHFPPAGDYRFILCDRDHGQQARSIRQWIEVTNGLQIPKNAIGKLKTSIDRDWNVIAKWAKANAKGGVRVFRFEETIRSPEKAAKRLASFAGDSLDTAAMAAAVHARTTKCHKGLLELKMMEAKS